MTKLEELNERLKKEVVKFKFMKKNGEERIATGTRMSSYLEEKNAVPTGNGSEKSNVTTYYDIEKEGWRSFSNDSFIEILN